MRVLFDALRFVSQACDILHTAEFTGKEFCGRHILTAAALFWTMTVCTLRWKLEKNNGTCILPDTAVSGDKKGDCSILLITMMRRVDPNLCCEQLIQNWLTCR